MKKHQKNTSTPKMKLYPALRATQAGRLIYSTIIPFKDLKNLIIQEKEYITPINRANRTISKTRVEKIANYILQNQKSFTLPAITISIDNEKFSSYPNIENYGTIQIKKMDIIDGQHRCHAIVKTLESNPNTIDTISAFVLIASDLKDRQQMFTDLNKNPVKPPKSLSYLYDKRDTLAQFIVKELTNIPIFHTLEYEKASPPFNSIKTFSLSHIINATKIIKHDKKLIIDYWKKIASTIPEYQMLEDKKIIPREIRELTLLLNANFLSALGNVGNQVLKEQNWKHKITKLNKLDFHKSNVDWENKLILNGKLFNNSVGISEAAKYMMEKINE